MMYKFTHNAPYGVTAIYLDNGDDVIYLHGECLASSDVESNYDMVMSIGERLAATLGVPFQLLELPVPESEEWCWNDITDSLGWGNTVTLPAGCVVTELQLSTAHRGPPGKRKLSHAKTYFCTLDTHRIDDALRCQHTDAAT